MKARDPSAVPCLFNREPETTIRNAYELGTTASFSELGAMADLPAATPNAMDIYVRDEIGKSLSIEDFYRREGYPKVDVQVNPADEQVLGPRQQAVVIAAARPAL